MYSGIDCAIWTVLGLGLGGIVGWCIGIITAYKEDWKVEDCYPEDEGEEDE